VIPLCGRLKVNVPRESAFYRCQAEVFGVKEILFAKHYYIVWLIYFLDLSSASDMPTNKLGEK